MQAVQRHRLILLLGGADRVVVPIANEVIVG